MATTFPVPNVPTADYNVSVIAGFSCVDVPSAQTKRCSLCAITKAIDQFGKRTDRAKGARSRCSQCTAVYNKGFNSKNRRARDLTGQRFGALVVQCVEKSQHPMLWRCTCDCGVICVKQGQSLLFKTAIVKSCGCLKAEQLKLTANARASKSFERRSFRSAIEAKNRVYRQYRQGARRRGYEFELSVETFFALAASDCHYCGQAPSNVSKSAKSRSQSQFVYNGIDRMSNGSGYVIGNVAPCCRTCNRAKMAMGYAQFIEWLARASVMTSEKLLAHALLAA
jgi:hypothetical protein